MANKWKVKEKAREGRVTITNGKFDIRITEEDGYVSLRCGKDEIKTTVTNLVSSVAKVVEDYKANCEKYLAEYQKKQKELEKRYV